MSKKIIMLIEDLFEDIEAIYPYYRLIEEGYEVTGFKSIITPLKLAGGILMNNRVVTDGNMITAQDAADVVEFTKAVIVLIKANK